MNASPMLMVQKTIKLLREHYGSYLSIQRTHAKTIHSMELNVGDPVYYRTFATPHSTPRGMKTLLPRFLIGTIFRILGPTSLAIKDGQSGSILTRHISDICEFHPPTRFSAIRNFDQANKFFLNQENGCDLVEQTHKDIVNVPIEKADNIKLK